MKRINTACIVEDEPIHLFITKRIVELTGMVDNLLVYTNGKEAFEKLHSIFLASGQLPEIILLDLNMPIWDGWQFLDEFNKIPLEKKIVIYILTSSNNPDDLKRAESYHLSDHYIIKPIELEQLKEMLANLN